jgi:hypothetical protein
MPITSPLPLTGAARVARLDVGVHLDQPESRSLVPPNIVAGLDRLVER